MNRRAGRELALQMLFAGCFWNGDLELAGKNVLKTSTIDPEVGEFANSIFEGTLASLAKIDELISARLNNWKLDRLHKVDLSIIRMAVFELLHPEETPSSVVIDQAVRLGKKFGGDESGRFVNGILGGIFRELEKKNDEEKGSD